MTFESVCKYSDESISQVKELLNFLKKRQQIEQEYSSNLCMRPSDRLIGPALTFVPR